MQLECLNVKFVVEWLQPVKDSASVMNLAEGDRNASYFDNSTEGGTCIS